jgi:hypothetical protein
MKGRLKLLKVLGFRLPKHKRPSGLSSITSQYDWVKKDHNPLKTLLNRS